LLSDALNITKQVALRDILFSNSMVEATNKIMKYQYLFTKDLHNYEAVSKYLDFAVPDFNNRPHYSLHSLTPNEVLSGHIPDKHKFTEAIKTAKTARIAENRSPECLINCQNPQILTEHT